MPDVGILARGLDLDRAGLVPAHAPVGDVEVMADPVHVLAAAEVHVPAPVHVDAGLAVGPPGGRPDPELVVEVRRRRDERLLAERPGEVVMPGGQADLDPLDLADAPVADELRGLVEVLDRPLPRARLPDPAVALDRVAEGPALAQVVGQGLFAVDVESGPQGRDGQDGVPVVGHGDRHGVEVLAQIELAEIVVGRRRPCCRTSCRPCPWPWPGAPCRGRRRPPTGPRAFRGSSPCCPGPSCRSRCRP